MLGGVEAFSMGRAGSKRPSSRRRWGSAAASDSVGWSSGWLVGLGMEPPAAALLLSVALAFW